MSKFGTIYEKGISYPSEVRRLLQQRAGTQDAMVFKLFQKYRGIALPVFRVADQLGISRENSVARSMNTLTNDDPEVNSYLDRFGNPPLIKTDEMQWNSDRSARVHRWSWNPDYGIRKPVDKTGQVSLFESKGCVI